MIRTCNSKNLLETIELVRNKRIEKLEIRQSEGRYMMDIKSTDSELNAKVDMKYYVDAVTILETFNKHLKSNTVKKFSFEMSPLEGVMVFNTSYDNEPVTNPSTNDKSDVEKSLKDFAEGMLSITKNLKLEDSKVKGLFCKTGGRQSRYKEASLSNALVKILDSID